MGETLARAALENYSLDLDDDIAYTADGSTVRKQGACDKAAREHGEIHHSWQNIFKDLLCLNGGYGRPGGIILRPIVPTASRFRSCPVNSGVTRTNRSITHQNSIMAGYDS
jgi:hypothetical protein